LLIDAELVSTDRLAPLLDECNQFVAILTTIAKKVKAHGN
jgi:hypothetical protein